MTDSHFESHTPGFSMAFESNAMPGQPFFDAAPDTFQDEQLGTPVTEVTGFAFETGFAAKQRAKDIGALMLDQPENID